MFGKRLSIDHHNFRRICFIITNSDLAGFYDRMIHTAAALELIRIGISRERIKSMFDSIQRMTHRTITAFSDSELIYGGDGIGDYKNLTQWFLQCSVSRSDIWTDISSVVK